MTAGCPGLAGGGLLRFRRSASRTWSAEALRGQGRAAQLHRLGGLVPDDLQGRNGGSATSSASSRPTTGPSVRRRGCSAPTTAPICRSMPHNVAAGAHTIVVRVDWRDPERQAEEGFHRTWFNWGGLDGEVEVRPLGRSAPQRGARRRPEDDPCRHTGERAGQRAGTQLRRDAHPQPDGSLSGSEQIPLSFPRRYRPHGRDRHGDGDRGGARTQPCGHRRHRTSTPLPRSPGESTYSAHVGLRQLTWHGGDVYLERASGCGFTALPSRRTCPGAVTR